MRSISSHSSAKNPVTHVPVQPPGGVLLLTSDLGVGVDLGVDVLTVVVSRDGLTTNSEGLLLLPSLNICLETQHFIFEAQMASTSRMASQKPANLSATHTPGHFSI